MKMKLFFVCFSVFVLFASIQAQSSAFFYQTRFEGLKAANNNTAFKLFELPTGISSFTLPNDFFGVRRNFDAPLLKSFDITSTNNLLITGISGGKIPTTGPGLRMMFYGAKGAFRVGSVTATEWDDSTAFPIGFDSIAMGYNTLAKGDYSIATGFKTEARGDSSTAMGAETVAKGRQSTAMGLFSKAFGDFSTAMGVSTLADGDNSTAMGYNTKAIGKFSTAMGTSTTASGLQSTAMGTAASTNGQTGSFVYGDSISTQFLSITADEFAVRAKGGFRFRTSANILTGCNLAGGSGSFSCSSSKTLKENFQSLNYTNVLERLRRIDVQQWTYKDETAGIFHIGAFAEDFYREFGLGADDKSIGLLDISGVNMAAIKALDEQTQNLQKENNSLKEQLQKQQLLLDGLKKFVCSQNPQADICR